MAPHNDVKELGRKARARRDQERNRRAEVVQITPEEAKLISLEEQKQKDTRHSSQQQRDKVRKSGNRSTRGGKRILDKASSSPRKYNDSKKKKSRHLSWTSTVPDNADMWIPDVSHIQNSESKSSLVRLHGLPVGTTPSSIKRFFSGLHPKFIGILIPCNTEIIQWDAKDYSKHLPKVERYPSRFRVVVKFDSAPTAELAADRSGETINTTNESTKDTNSTAESILRVSIGVTQIPKSHVTLILQNLAIDAASTTAQNSDPPLHTTLSLVEKDILPMVAPILWMDAQQEIKLSFDPPHPWSFSIRDRPEEVLEEGKDILLSRDDDFFPSRNVELQSENDTIQRCIRHRNNLFAVKQSLQQSFPFPAAQLLDFIYGQDPTVRLAHQASVVLNKRIRRLDDRLLQSRRQRFFSQVTWVWKECSTHDDIGGINFNHA